MTDHITALARSICEAVPSEQRPNTDDDLDLFRIYAVLARAKGLAVTHEDVHDAWCAWMASRDPDHSALVPFDQLGSAQQEQDIPFTRAISQVARDLPGVQDPDHAE